MNDKSITEIGTEGIELVSVREYMLEWERGF